MLLLVVLVVVVAMIASRFIDLSGNPYPFTKRGQLFTQVEQIFLQLLEAAVGNEFRIVSRVRMNELIDFKQGVTARNRRAALVKAKAKTLDFVLLDKDTLQVVAAIDLVNNNDKNGHKAQQDWFVNGALETCGIPLIRMKVRNDYKINHVREAIMFKIGKKIAPKPMIRGTRAAARQAPRPKPAVLSPSQARLASPNPTALVQL